MAGDKISIADFCIVTIVKCVEIFGDMLNRFPRLSAWLERCNSLPYFEEACGSGHKVLAEVFNEKINM